MSGIPPVNGHGTDFSAPEKKGWLWKKGGSKGMSGFSHGRRNWKRRWFVLRAAQLLYFKAPGLPFGSQLGGFDLCACSVDKNTFEETKRSHSFALRTSRRSFYMADDDDAGVDDWLLAIEAHTAAALGNGRHVGLFARASVRVDNLLQGAGSPSAAMGLRPPPDTTAFRLTSKGVWKARRVQIRGDVLSYDSSKAKNAAFCLNGYSVIENDSDMHYILGQKRSAPCPTKWIMVLSPPQGMTEYFALAFNSQPELVSWRRYCNAALQTAHGVNGRPSSVYGLILSQHRVRTGASDMGIEDEQSTISRSNADDRDDLSSLASSVSFTGSLLSRLQSIESGAGTGSPAARPTGAGGIGRGYLDAENEEAECSESVSTTAASPSDAAAQARSLLRRSRKRKGTLSKMIHEKQPTFRALVHFLLEAFDGHPLAQRASQFGIRCPDELFTVGLSSSLCDKLVDVLERSGPSLLQSDCIVETLLKYMQNGSETQTPKADDILPSSKIGDICLVAGSLLKLMEDMPDPIICGGCAAEAFVAVSYLARSTDSLDGGPGCRTSASIRILGHEGDDESEQPRFVAVTPPDDAPVDWDNLVQALMSADGGALSDVRMLIDMMTRAVDWLNYLKTKSEDEIMDDLEQLVSLFAPNVIGLGARNQRFDPLSGGILSNDWGRLAAESTLACLLINPECLEMQGSRPSEDMKVSASLRADGNVRLNGAESGDVTKESDEVLNDIEAIWERLVDGEGHGLRAAGRAWLWDWVLSQDPSTCEIVPPLLWTLETHWSSMGFMVWILERIQHRPLDTSNPELVKQVRRAVVLVRMWLDGADGGLLFGHHVQHQQHSEEISTPTKAANFMQLAKLEYRHIEDAEHVKAHVRDLISYLEEHSLKNLGEAVLASIERAIARQNITDESPNDRAGVGDSGIGMGMSSVPLTSDSETVMRSNTWQVLDLTPVDIARQLTLVEASLFAKIRPIELLDQSVGPMRRRRAPHIVALVEHFNRVSLWVATCVVTQVTVSKRAQVISQFIEIAHHCRVLNNFNGLMEILAGLNQSSVHRLRKTWRAVPRKILRQYEDLNGTMMFGKNHKRYRELIKQCRPPCVPYLGVAMTDITFLLDGSGDKLVAISGVQNSKSSSVIVQRSESGQGPQLERCTAKLVNSKEASKEFLRNAANANIELVNIQKVRMIGESIKEMLSHRGAYPLEDVLSVQTAIARLPFLSEDRLYSASLIQEPRETN